MNLDVQNWRYFKFGDLIKSIKKAHAFTKDELDKSDCISAPSIRYITRTAENNGCEFIANSYELEYIEKGNAITIGDTTATCFYQEEQFITGDHMIVIRADWLNKYTGLFISTVLNNEQYRYSYGRAFLMDKVNSTLVKLPIRYNSDGSPFIDSTKQFSSEGFVPDWRYMEEYIKSLHYLPLTTKNKTTNKICDASLFREFVFGDLIKSIKKAHAYTKDELDETESLSDSSIRYITRTAENNGCELTVNSNGLEYIEKGNAISIGDTTATCFYQEEPFITGDHMIVIRAEWLNKYTGLFITTLLNREQYRYSYGRAFVIDRVKETVIKLPICYNSDGSPFIDPTKKFSPEGFVPDWQSMEDYIKALPYGDRLEG